jgi:hypothetical protein
MFSYSLRPFFLATAFCSAIFLSRATFAAAPPVDLPSGIQEVYRFRGDLYAGFPDAIYVSRSGELATVLSHKPQGSSTANDYLLFHSPVRGQFEIDLPGSESVFSYSFSNWGAVVRSSDRVYSIEFGESPEQIYDGHIGRVFVNDSGLIAFSSRNSTSTGLKDIWTRSPGGPLVALPDVGEFRLEGQLLVDSQGRVLQSHWLDGIIPIDAPVFRYGVNGQWEDVTANFGETGERVLEIVDREPINNHGDFAFASIIPAASGHTFRINKFVAESESFVRIHERPYVATTFVEELKLADTGEMLIQIKKQGTLTREILRYRPGDLAATDLSMIQPTGNLDFPSMNNHGDIVYGVRDELGLYDYFLLESNSTVPASIQHLSDLPLPLRNIVITDEDRLYFWMSFPNDQWVLGTTPVPEPSTSHCALILLFGGSVYFALQLKRGRSITKASP